MQSYCFSCKALISFVLPFTDEGWKTVGSANHAQPSSKRKRPLFTTSTPTKVSNCYSGLPTDDEDSIDSLDDILDFNAFLARMKRRRKRTSESTSSFSSSESDIPLDAVDDLSNSPSSLTLEERVKEEFNLNPVKSK